MIHLFGEALANGSFIIRQGHTCLPRRIEYERASLDPNGPAWVARTRHAASVFVHDDALWVVAGNNMESDVWKMTRRRK
jgi:hypothetical protein